MPTTYLNIANPTVGDRQKGTISVWIKRSKIGSTQYFVNERSDNNNMAWIAFSGGDALNWGDQVSGVSQFEYTTNRKFRDTSAWYHFVFAWDTTLATASERVRTYVNGVEETSFATTNNPSQNYSSNFSRGTTSYPAIIGRLDSGTYYFGGSMAHFHRVDGQQLTPSTFGQTDSTTGIWKPKTNPSITYTGSSSFNYFLKFENTSDYGEDSSGENNDFSVGGGTMTQTIDTPSNVFATFNGAFNTNLALSNANTKVSNSTTTWEYCMTTLGASAGKYYCEFKAELGNGYNMLGAADFRYATSRDRNSYTHIGAGTGGVGLYYDGQKYVQDTNTNYAGSYTTGDIIGVALDMDNAKIYFSKNGVWANGTGGWGSSTFDSTVGAISLPTTGTYGFGASTRTGGAATLANFGNGYFGTTAVSSAGTNAGVGTFEYDVPSGYKALCTKNINAEEYS
jgi:hypothetical protein